MQTTVEATYIFKDLVNDKCPKIELLQGTKVSLDQSSVNSDNFGPLIRVKDNLILTWYNTAMYMVDPSRGCLVGVQSGFGPIKDVAVCDNEAFILRGGSSRWLVRIAAVPDPWTPRGIRIFL